MTPRTIKAARAGLGMTQRQLADAAGVHTRTVINVEAASARKLASWHGIEGGAVARIKAALEAQGVVIQPDSVTFPQD